MTAALREIAPRTAALALGAVLVAGLALRLAAIHEQRGDVLFDHPPLDEDRYVESARALAAGRPALAEPYWQPPGIEYVLAATFRAAGPGLLWPRYLQALASIACCLVVYLLGRRWLSRRAALVAAALLALNGVVIHAATELLPAVWQALLDLLALWLLVRARERASWPLALAAGLALGLSAILKPVILVFAPLALAWLWPVAPGARRLALVGALLLGLVAPIAPVTAHNRRVGGEWVLVATNGGLNFYLGNNGRYHELLETRPGRRWEELTTEARRAGVLRPGAESGYYARKGLAWIAGHPAAAAKLSLRKLYLFASGREIPRDTDIIAARDQSRVLWATVRPGPLALPGGLLLPLALIGLAVALATRPRGGALVLVLGYLGVQALVVSAFFVTSRYRVPALPALTLLAVGGGAWLGGCLRRGAWPRRGLVAVGLVALVVVLNLPTRESSASYRAELDFYRGLAHQRHLGDPGRAVAAFARAAAADPSDPRFSFELGNTLADSGRFEDATVAWEQAAAADPWDVRPRRRAAMALMRRGDHDGARRALQANIDARARAPAVYAFEHFSLCVLLAMQGQAAAALAELQTASRLDRQLVRAKAVSWAQAEARRTADGGFWLQVGELLWQGGDRVAAMQIWRAAAGQLSGAARAQVTARLHAAGEDAAAVEIFGAGP